MATAPSILLVDPDLNSRADVKKALERAHFTLAGESGLGIDAITLARNVEADVIVIGFEDPVAPALQTIESLGNALPETPIIVYSSLSNMEIVRKAMLAGSRDYLLKPVSSGDLMRSINAVLESEEKRRMRHARQTQAVPAEGTIITVASLKGGVGKSTTSVNLAVALRRATEQSVALVDAEPNFGDVAVLLKIDDVNVRQGMAYVAQMSQQLDRNSVLDYMVPHPTGVQVLPTATYLETWQDVDPSDVRRLVSLIAQTQDYVIIDTPSGLNGITAAALESALLILLVTTPDITSLKDTILALNLLKSWGIDKERVKVIMNHVHPPNGVRADDVKLVLDHEIFWNLPNDPLAQSAAQLGQPIIMNNPDAKFSQSISGLARLISGARHSERKSLIRLLPVW